MTRKLYGGYGLTEMRRYAAEYKIPGRSKMDGYRLLEELHNYWDARRQEKELAVLEAGTIVPGTQMLMECGCRIQATTPVLEDDRLDYADRPKPLFIRATMLAFCVECSKHHPAGVNWYNQQAREYPYRFMLYQLHHLPATEQVGLPHAFKASYSGMVCDQMVELADGTGDACGRPAADKIHQTPAPTEYRTCGAPNPYPINGRCTKLAGHDNPTNDLETKLHSNGFSRWSCEDLARQAELTDDEVTRLPGLTAAVQSAAERSLAVLDWTEKRALADALAHHGILETKAHGAGVIGHLVHCHLIEGDDVSGHHAHLTSAGYFVAQRLAGAA